MRRPPPCRAVLAPREALATGNPPPARPSRRSARRHPRRRHDRGRRHDHRGRLRPLRGQRYRVRVDLDLISEVLADEPAYRSRQVWEWVARGATTYSEMTNLPVESRTLLEEQAPFSTLTLVHEAKSVDGTVKALFHTHDGHPLEAVLMRFRDGRRSVCISSQSGCALTCTFCATGQMQFRRNLTAWEVL